MKEFTVIAPLKGLALEGGEIYGWKIVFGSWKINNAESEEHDEDKSKEEKRPQKERKC